MGSIDSIKVHKANSVKLPRVERLNLEGVPVYVLRGTSEPVLHLELIFNAGRVHAAHPADSSATAAMLNEGTALRTSAEIAEQIEFFGSTVRSNSGTDALSIGVYSLSRHFGDTLEILEDILTSARFPQQELDHYIQNRLHKLEIASQQNEFVATRAVMGSIFDSHVYGYSADTQDIKQLERHNLLGHYQLLGKSNLSVFVCGDVQDSHLNRLKQMLAALGEGTLARACSAPDPSSAQEHLIDGPQHMQCAIRLGRQVVQRSHEDFPGLFVLNTILGGYFGSRLMKNIREDKGLTYGISSSLETLGQSTVFMISTESSDENREVVLKEIRSEIDALLSNLVGKAELDMVLNYTLGNLMMQLDGPFRSMEVVKTMMLEGLPISHFDEFVDAIQRTHSDTLRELAHKYLQWDSLHKVFVY